MLALDCGSRRVDLSGPLSQTERSRRVRSRSPAGEDVSGVPACGRLRAPCDARSRSLAKLTARRFGSLSPACTLRCLRSIAAWTPPASRSHTPCSGPCRVHLAVRAQASFRETQPSCDNPAPRSRGPYLAVQPARSRSRKPYGPRSRAARSYAPYGTHARGRTNNCTLRHSSPRSRDRPDLTAQTPALHDSPNLSARASVRECWNLTAQHPLRDRRYLRGTGHSPGTHPPKPCGSGLCATHPPKPCGPGTCATQTPKPCGPGICATRTPKPCGPGICAARTSKPCGPSVCAARTPEPCGPDIRAAQTPETSRSRHPRSRAPEPCGPDTRASTARTSRHQRSPAATRTLRYGHPPAFARTSRHGRSPGDRPHLSVRTLAPLRLLNFSVSSSRSLVASSPKRPTCSSS